MSQRKRKASHPSIKQCFVVSLNKKKLAVALPESANTSSVDCKGSFDSVVHEEQHSTVRISKASSLPANSELAASNNKTFHFLD